MGQRILFFLLFLTVLAGFVVILALQLDHSADPVSLLPAETIVMVDLKKPAAAYRSFKQSAMGRQFGTVPWPEVLGQLGLGPDVASVWLRRTKDIDTMLTHPAIRELIGRRAVVALVPPLPGTDGSETAADPEKMVMLIARPVRNARVTDFLSTLSAPEHESTVESYLGREIRTYVLKEGRTVSVVIADGLVMASFSASLLKRCLAISLRNLTEGETGLKGKSVYSRLRMRSGGDDDQFVYVNFKALQTLKKSFPSAASALPDEGSLALFRRQSADKIRYTAIWQKKAMPYPEAGSPASGPEKNEYLPSVPAGLLAYFWTNRLNLSRMLPAAEKTVSRSGMLPVDPDGWLVVNTSLSREEFLSLFGNHFSMYVSAMRATGFLPMPRICFRLQIHDRQGMEKMLTRIFNALDVQQSIFRNIPVYTILLAGGLIQPAYAVTDNFLLFADSRQQLEQVLAGNNDPLVRTDLYRTIDIGLAEANNVTAFFKNSELMDGLKEFALLTGTLLAASDKQQAVKIRALIENLVMPVLEGLKMYTAQNLRIYSTKDELVVDSALLVGKKDQKEEI